MHNLLRHQQQHSTARPPRLLPQEDILVDRETTTSEIRIGCRGRASASHEIPLVGDREGAEIGVISGTTETTCLNATLAKREDRTHLRHVKDTWNRVQGHIVRQASNPGHINIWEAVGMTDDRPKCKHRLNPDLGLLNTLH